MTNTHGQKRGRRRENLTKHIRADFHVHARKYAIGILGREAGISVCTCGLLSAVLNDSTNFIYSGNENPNRLSLRCYIFLPGSERPGVPGIYVRTFCACTPRARAHRLALSLSLPFSLSLSLSLSLSIHIDVRDIANPVFYNALLNNSMSNLVGVSEGGCLKKGRAVSCCCSD